MTPERLANLTNTVLARTAPPAWRQEALLKILLAAIRYPDAMEESIIMLLPDEEVTS